MALVAAGKTGDAIATLFGFSANIFGLIPKSTTPTNTIRLYIGQQQVFDMQSGVDRGKSTGGTRPGVAVWDSNGAPLGADRSTGSVPAGGFVDYSFASSGGIPAEYVSVSALGTDGVCISAVVLADAGGQGAAWLGDVGRDCGAPFYVSNAQVGDADHIPDCVWIDTNADKGHKYNGFSIHMPSFLDTGLNDTGREARHQQWEARPELMCKSVPRFTMWDEITVDNAIKILNRELDHTLGVDSEADIDTLLNSQNWVNSQIASLGDPQPGKGSTPPQSQCFKKAAEDCLPTGPSALENLSKQDPTKRRRAKVMRQIRQPRIMPDDLVISNITKHSAEFLCSHEMSEGPDFVSLQEGLFCDMSTLTNRKQLYQLCSHPEQKNCFEMDTYSIRRSSNDSPNSNSTVSSFNQLDIGKPQRSYKRIQNWG